MNNKILIVDDMEVNREILKGILLEQYDIIEASDGNVAIELIHENEDSLVAVLLDIVMPVADGFSVLRVMRDKGLNDKIPVIVISSESSVASEREAFFSGVSDFIHKPFDPIIVRHRVDNIVNLYLYRKSLENKVEMQTGKLLTQYNMVERQRAKLAIANEELQREHEKLLKSINCITNCLGTVVEFRSNESGEHINRVKGYTKILALKIKDICPEYGLTNELIDRISDASALHDIGKIHIPDTILLKPAKLTSEEFERMKLHTTIGADMILKMHDAWDEEYGRLSYEICRYHHERFDGKGYPDGLEGDEIPISAQIVSVADVYDALVHKRIYKDAYQRDEAFDMILNGKCGCFSPKLLDAFRLSRTQLESM